MPMSSLKDPLLYECKPPGVNRATKPSGTDRSFMQEERPVRPRWWLNPYLHLILNGVLVSVSEILLKVGAA